MIASTVVPCFQPDPGRLQAGFLVLLPRIELHARVSFRHLKCPHRRADAIAEAVALAWTWYVGLARRGHDAARFPGALASFAVRAVRSGRRLCGQERARDALSPAAQRRHGFAVGRLPDCSTPSSTPLADALQDNTRSPVPDQVVFRQDFPAWRSTRSERDRRVIDDLMVGERARDVAHRCGLCPGRVSQLRREFRDDWERFGSPPGQA